MAWRNRIVGEGEERPEDLLANPQNWRIHPDRQQRALSDVLNTVGLVQRIIVNRRTGFVVDGHGRVALAITEGEETVPVEYVDLAPDEEAVVLASFDSIGAMAGTDPGKLGELIAEAKESEAARANADLSGFLEDLRTRGARSAAFAGDGGFSGGEPGDGFAGGEDTGMPPASPGDPGEDRYKEQYGVIVICTDEAHQEEVYEELLEAGHEVRVVVT